MRGEASLRKGCTRGFLRRRCARNVESQGAPRATCKIACPCRCRRSAAAIERILQAAIPIGLVAIGPFQPSDWVRLAQIFLGMSCRGSRALHLVECARRFGACSLMPDAPPDRTNTSRRGAESSVQGWASADLRPLAYGERSSQPRIPATSFSNFAVCSHRRPSLPLLSGRCGGFRSRGASRSPRAFSHYSRSQNRFLSTEKKGDPRQQARESTRKKTSTVRDLAARKVQRRAQIRGTALIPIARRRIHKPARSMSSLGGASP